MGVGINIDYQVRVLFISLLIRKCKMSHDYNTNLTFTNYFAYAIVMCMRPSILKVNAASLFHNGGCYHAQRESLRSNIAIGCSSLEENYIWHVHLFQKMEFTFLTFLALTHLSGMGHEWITLGQESPCQDKSSWGKRLLKCIKNRDSFR